MSRDEGGYSRNLTDSLTFRKVLVLLLRLSGVEVQAKPSRTRHSDDADRPAGDIWGVPQWTILTRKEVTLDLSGGLRAAKAAGAADHNPKSATVWAKKGSPAEESYVVMDFETFTKILQEEQERGNA